MPVVNPGIRRFLGSAIQRLFNGASFSAPLTHSAIPTRAASGTTGTFTRATTSTWPNNDGYMVTGVAGEIGFVGARRVRNLLSFTSEDNTNAAYAILGGSRTATTFTSTLGTHEIYTSTNIAAGGTSLNGRTFIFSVELAAGTASSVYIGFEDTTAWTAGHGYQSPTPITLTSTPTRYSLSYTFTAATGTNLQLAVGPYAHQGQAAGNLPAGSITVTDWQIEEVTAQTTQTAGEYVSVGVPSDWQGTELVTNGTFDTATTGWTAVNSTFSQPASDLRITNVGANAGYGHQAITTVIGQKYVVSASITVGTSSSWGVYVGNSPGSGAAGFTGTTSGVFSSEFTATATTTYISPINTQAVDGRYTTFDNISVKPAYYHGSFVDGVACFDYYYLD